MCDVLFSIRCWELKKIRVCPNQRRHLLAGGKTLSLNIAMIHCELYRGKQLLKERKWCLHLLTTLIFIPGVWKTPFILLPVRVWRSLSCLFWTCTTKPCDARRSQRERARMLCAGNLSDIQIGWHVVGSCWLDTPTTRGCGHWLPLLPMGLQWVRSRHHRSVPTSSSPPVPSASWDLQH